MTEAPRKGPRTSGGAFLRRYARNRAALLGAAVVVSLAVVAVFAPIVATHSYTRVSLDTFQPPGPIYLFGTDDLGRDTFSGVVMGARTSLSIGLVAALTSVFIGVVVGLVAGYYGGVVDEILMRIAEFVLVTPTFFLVLVTVAILGPSLTNIVIIIGLFSWPRIARVIRGQVLSLRELEYVQAVAALGAKNLRIAFRHVLPNALPAVVVIGTLQAGQAILTESALSFLGLGDPNAASWGKMLYNAQQFLNRSLWPAFFPGFAVFLVVLGVNLAGDGLNDALNPRMRSR